MNRIRFMPLVRILAGLAAAVAVFGAAAPAAFAREIPPPGPLSRYQPVVLVPTHSHAAAAVGMPGWQITLIAAGAAIVAAAVAVLLDRARSARRLAAAATS